MKANMLMPLNKPNAMDITNITPEMEKIDDSKAMRRKWDQPGVVGENDNCKKVEANETKAASDRFFVVSPRSHFLNLISCMLLTCSRFFSDYDHHRTTGFVAFASLKSTTARLTASTLRNRRADFILEISLLNLHTQTDPCTIAPSDEESQGRRTTTPTERSPASIAR